MTLLRGPNVGLLAGIHVGFDLHDKYFDVLTQFQLILKMRTDVDVPLTKLRKELIQQDPRINPEDYEMVKVLLFEQPKFFKKVESLPGASTNVVKMHLQGAKLTAITASGPQAKKNILAWDEHHGELAPYVKIVSSGRGGSKVEEAKKAQLHYFSDNKLKNIYELRKIVPRLCFFIRPNNWHEHKRAARWAKLIESWDEYYDYIAKDAPRLREELNEQAVGRVHVPISTRRVKQPQCSRVPNVDHPEQKISTFVDPTIDETNRPIATLHTK